MLQGKSKTVQDYIIEHLSLGASDIHSIHAQILRKRKVSIQAVYDQLRKLISDEIVLKNKTIYILNREWVEKIRNTFMSLDAPLLNEGESVTYTFKSLGNMDSFWKHLFHTYDYLKPRVPVCIYNEHCFWVYLYGREMSEIEHYHSYKKLKRKAFFLIGGTSDLDITFKKKYGDSYFRVNTKKTTSIKPTHHITIIDDVIINSKVPQSFAKNIHRIYEDITLTEIEKIKEINELSKSIKRVSLRVERNKLKAQKLQKIILRDFYLNSNEKKNFNY